ncbi:AEC family transporter [Lachnospiraceae bacterium OM02-31]|nr:AEC family transporter [Lachnospiraceae bacterium OM02-31]RJW53101.1 AEC family transporter [Lachnospiraceae bacterium OM02-3]
MSMASGGLYRMNTFIVFQQMLILLAMMVIGYVSFRKDWLDRNAYTKLSKIVVNILNPLIIINGVMERDSGESTEKIVLNLMFIVLYFVILILTSFLVVRLLKVEARHSHLYRMMMVFSNVGFMAIPLISSIYGKESVFYVSFYILGFNLLLYTYGIHLISRGSGDKKEKLQLKKLMNPGVAACLLSIVIFVWRIPVADSVKSFVSYMGNAAIPMSMMLIGASIAQTDIKELLRDVKIYGLLALKLLALPIAAALILRNLELPRELAGIFIFMLGMPVASIVVPLAAEYEADEICCTRGTVLSTLLSIITIPIVSLFM